MKVRKQIGPVFQTSSLDDKLTRRENLSFHSRLYNVPREVERKRIEELREKVGLSDRLDEETRNQLIHPQGAGGSQLLLVKRGLMFPDRCVLIGRAYHSRGIRRQ